MAKKAKATPSAPSTNVPSPVVTINNRIPVAGAVEIPEAREYVLRWGGKWNGPLIAGIERPKQKEASDKEPGSKSGTPSAHAHLAKINNMRSGTSKDDSHYAPGETKVYFTKSGEIIVKGSKYTDEGISVEPTPDEAIAILAAFKLYEFPKSVTLPRQPKWREYPNLPQRIRDIREDYVWCCHDIRWESLIKIHFRVDTYPDGEDGPVRKRYYNITPYAAPAGTVDENGVVQTVIWQIGEPDEPFAMYYPRPYRDEVDVLVCEGAKAAKIGQRICDMEYGPGDFRCGIGAELVGFYCVGWLGGAVNYWGFDFSDLEDKPLERVIVAADNDEGGREAAYAISRKIKFPCWVLSFDYYDERTIKNGEAKLEVKFVPLFPEAFDIADEFPESLYAAQQVGAPIYFGPSLDQLTHEVTQITYAHITDNPNNPDEPLVSIRMHAHARRCVTYLRDTQEFIDESDPKVPREDKKFMQHIRNRIVKGTTTAMFTPPSPYVRRNEYLPGFDAGIVNMRGEYVRNSYSPSRIRPAYTDEGPYVEHVLKLFDGSKYLSDMFHDFACSLVSHPEIKMSYMLLLISYQTGIGKGAIANQVLRPLIGPSNFGLINANKLDGKFNSHYLNKTLGFIDEIHRAERFTFVNTMNTIITEPMISIELKGVDISDYRNTVNIIATSNEDLAINIVEKDRRIAVMPLTETHLGNDYNEWFYGQYLTTGGLQAIRRFYDERKTWVRTGEHAPITERKRQMIDDGYTAWERDVVDLCERWRDSSEFAAFSDVEILDALLMRHKLKESVLKASTIRRLFSANGMVKFESRMKVRGRSCFVLMNKSLHNLLGTMEPDLQRAKLHEVSEQPMEYEVGTQSMFPARNL